MALRTSVMLVAFLVAGLTLGLLAAGCGGTVHHNHTGGGAHHDGHHGAAELNNRAGSRAHHLRRRAPLRAASPRTPSPMPRDSAASHTMGQDVYLIIGASMSTEDECQALLDKADPLFGDMQIYFVIQRSDNFTGLQPGYFVLVEAHLDEPSAGRGVRPPGLSRRLCQRGDREHQRSHPLVRRCDGYFRRGVARVRGSGRQAAGRRTGRQAGRPSAGRVAGYTLNSGSFFSTATFLSVT